MNAPFRKSSLIIALFLSFNTNAVQAIDFDIQKEASKKVNDAIGDSVKLERQSKLYYKLGGSRPLSAPPSHNADLKVGGKLKFGAGYSCGKFDPSASLQNFMNNLKNGVDDAMNTVSQAASSAVAGLPALLLSRNSPDLYELLQTNVFRAEEKLKFNSASCQEIERQLASGENPYKQWTELAQGTSLNEESESNPDVNTAMKEVEEDGGDNGVNLPVPGKGIIKAGGKGQDPIKVNTTASVTGYNIMLGRNPTDLNEPQNNKEQATEVVRNFKSPEELVQWTKSVIGEKDIYTTKNPDKEPEYTAGKGMIQAAADNRQEVIESLYEALSEDDKSKKIEILRESFKGTTPVTVGLLKRIEASDKDIQKNIIHSLAEEISMGNEIQKALIARRALIVSLSEPNIAASAAAKKSIKEAIVLIENEIERSMFEYRLRKELVTDFANTLYEEPVKPDAQKIEDGENKTPNLQLNNDMRQ